MAFEVFKRDDLGHEKRVMKTEHIECIEQGMLESMESANYYFKLDGRKVSAAHLKSHANQYSSNASNQATDATTRQQVVNNSTRTARQVICVDTGKVYKNQADAAKDLNIDPAQVSESIKTNRRRSGYLFQRYEYGE